MEKPQTNIEYQRLATTYKAAGRLASIASDAPYSPQAARVLNTKNCHLPSASRPISGRDHSRDRFPADVTFLAPRALRPGTRKLQILVRLGQMLFIRGRSAPWLISYPHLIKLSPKKEDRMYSKGVSGFIVFILSILAVFVLFSALILADILAQGGIVFSLR